MEELAAKAAEGYRAALLYVVQRGDCRRFRLAADIDPAYAKAHGRAREAGVETLAWVCRVALDAVTLERPMRIAEPAVG